MGDGFVRDDHSAGRLFGRQRAPDGPGRTAEVRDKNNVHVTRIAEMQHLLLRTGVACKIQSLYSTVGSRVSRFSCVQYDNPFFFFLFRKSSGRERRHTKSANGGP